MSSDEPGDCRQGAPVDALRQLATLNRIARVALEDLALQPMLQRIVDILHEAFGWEFVACASVDVAAGTFRCEAVRSDVPTEIVVGYQRALGSGVVGRCALVGQTIEVEDANEVPGFIDTLGGARSELCVPVVHDGEVLAVLNAESRQAGAFRGQRALLETVADQIVGAIRLAQLLEQLQRSNAQLRDAYARAEGLSRTDVLTGLANRRCLDEVLASCLAPEARAQAGAVALLMLDVDHFKAFNDGYGHPAGDACLRQVATLLVDVLDGTADCVARYGGEEFAVVLCGRGAEDAARVAERLRLAIEARDIAHHFARPGHLTLSIGVAACDAGENAALAALLLAADRALYAAKRAGRNRVRVAAATRAAAAGEPAGTGSGARPAPMH